MSLCQDGAVFISGQPARCVGCFKGGEGKLASGPVYHPSYLSPQQPPRGRARECTDEQKLVRCEREWGGGGTTTEGQEEGNEEDDR